MYVKADQLKAGDRVSPPDSSVGPMRVMAVAEGWAMLTFGGYGPSVHCVKAMEAYGWRLVGSSEPCPNCTEKVINLISVPDGLAVHCRECGRKLEVPEKGSNRLEMESVCTCLGDSLNPQDHRENCGFREGKGD